MSIKYYIFTILFLVSLCSCKEKSELYKVPNESFQTVASLKSTSDSFITANWKFPNYWIRQSDQKMRIATFAVSKDKHSLEVTVLRFPGQTGALLQNINRWRNQLSLQPILLNEISSYIKSVSVGDITYDLVEINNKHEKKSMKVAIIRKDAYSWFIKIFGDSIFLQDELDNFKIFTESVLVGL